MADAPDSVGVADVLITDELKRRPSRSPDYQAESEALGILAQKLNERPDELLQTLTDLIIEMGVAESAGVSILAEEGGKCIFRWDALSGAWDGFRGGTMPFDASPCGVVVRRDQMLLFAHPERVFPDAALNPKIKEILLVPFRVNGEPVGTLWINAHSPERKFDAEDARLMASLANFAAVAYQLNRELTEHRVAEHALRESEERQAFLLRLADLLRPLEAPDAIMETAARLLRAHLGGSRCAYYEIEGDEYVVINESAEGVPSFIGRHPLAAFGDALLEKHRSGKAPIVVEDVLAEHAHEELAGFESIQVGAYIGIPLVERGRFVAGLTVQSATPRSWSESDIALAQETAERTWAAVERARAEAALRASEMRLQLILHSMSDAVYVGTAEGITVANPAALEQLGYDSCDELNRHIGQLAEEIQTRDHATGAVISANDQAFARALRGEKVVQDVAIIHRKTGDERVLRSAASPLVENGRVVAAVAVNTDITARERIDAMLRESRERQAFLLKISDAVRQIVDPAEIQGETTRLLREQLNAGWCYYVDWNLDGKTGRVLRDSAREGLPSLAGEHDVSDASEFVQLLTADTVLRVRDYASYDQLPARIRQQFAALGFRSMMAAPLVKHGRLLATVIVGDSEIRDWTASEASLLVELAERTWAAAERARAEETVRKSEQRANLLLAELQHRVRNTLAVVRSIARRTAENSSSVEEMLAHFQGRLDAFSRVQAALTRNPHARVDIVSLIEDELLAHATRGGGQVSFKGPSISLESKAAERLSLAIHELTTNAVKHGALSNDQGRLEISWSEQRNGETSELMLTWKEFAMVDIRPKKREGFGMELLTRSLPYDIQGTTKVELASDGLRFELRMPLQRLDITA